MKNDPLAAAVRDTYDAVHVPAYPAGLVAAKRLARGPRSAPSRGLRFALAGAVGLLAGALFAVLPWPQHDRMVALFARDVIGASRETAVTRTVSLDDARRLARFPVIVPAGVPVDSVRIGADNASVQLVVEPRRGDRVLMVERAADGDDATSNWISGSTSLTVLGESDGTIVQRLRQATAHP
ncbi:MAG: hypothetical protein JWN27_1657 [Candidatus Eremiobacteraeota bacterium]|nr:hypothetical protein [Candidatus Eremiobacteraeota bacterium]